MTPDSFLLTNLKSEHTGLPFCVWIFSWDVLSSDDVRLWVSRTPKALPSEMVSVTIRPEVRVVEGKMSALDLALLKKWVELNREVLIRYRDGDIAYSEDAITALKPVRSVERQAGK